MAKYFKSTLFSFLALLVLGTATAIWFSEKKATSPEPVFCTQDAKVCSDGSYVARSGSSCEFTPCPKEKLITVEMPMAYEKIYSPVTIKGMARGSWFFEASFPIKLYDAKNNLLVQHYATAKGEWMTENFVPFESSLEFSIAKEQQGTLVLEKDNPSGLPENMNEIRIPVTLSPDMITITLFYYNESADKDSAGNPQCSEKGIISTKRQIPKTTTPLQDAINLLIKGQITEPEKAQGISTEYPLEGFSLKGADLNATTGVVTLEFTDPQHKTSGGSCRAKILQMQIEKTAKQFKEVEGVKFLPTSLFQP